MEQGPYWEADDEVAKEIPKVQCCVRKSRH
jgi:hypothetical protein